MPRNSAAVSGPVQRRTAAHATSGAGHHQHQLDPVHVPRYGPRTQPREHGQKRRIAWEPPRLWQRASCKQLLRVAHEAIWVRVISRWVGEQLRHQHDEQEDHDYQLDQ